MRTIGLIISLALMALFSLPVLAAEQEKKDSPYPPGTTKAEAELGAKTAQQIEKDYKLVKDEAALKRLHDICAAIVPVTERPEVVYTCKILDVGALNAMVIPGGTIYVTRGLLGAVESDDELAGVLAHEIAHNALCHAQKMMSREAKASLVQIAAVVGAIYASKGSEVNTGQILTMSELVKRGLLNGYGVEMEIEADAHAVRYLHKLEKYNPLGLYSVILGFRQIEKHAPQFELGYLKTHPYSDDRKTLIEARLKELGIRINLWQVVNFRAQAVEPKEEEKGYTVRMGEVDLITLQESHGDADAKTRAENAAKAINRALNRDYIQQFDIDVAMLNGNAVLRMRRIPVLTLVEADSAAAGASLENLGEIVLRHAREALWREVVKRGA